jgi:hypothetical protein
MFYPSFLFFCAFTKTVWVRVLGVHLIVDTKTRRLVEFSFICCIFPESLGLAINKFFRVNVFNACTGDQTRLDAGCR